MAKMTWLDELERSEKAWQANQPPLGDRRKQIKAAVKAGDFQLVEEEASGYQYLIVDIKEDGVILLQPAKLGAESFLFETSQGKIRIPVPSHAGRNDLHRLHGEALGREEWAKREAARDPEGAFGGRGNNAV